MKKKMIFLTMLVLGLGISHAAETTNPNRLNHNFYNIQERNIQRAFVNGFIGVQQKRILHNQLRNVMHVERRAWFDGRLTRNERRRIIQLKNNFENRLFNATRGQRGFNNRCDLPRNNRRGNNRRFRR